MDIHKEFTKWAAVLRVKLDGIATHRFPSRGFGIIAERELKVSRARQVFFICLINLPLSFALSILLFL